jgi:hypothetical protein
MLRQDLPQSIQHGDGRQGGQRQTAISGRQVEAAGEAQVQVAALGSPGAPAVTVEAVARERDRCDLPRQSRRTASHVAQSVELARAGVIDHDQQLPAANCLVGSIRKSPHRSYGAISRYESAPDGGEPIVVGRKAGRRQSGPRRLTRSQERRGLWSVAPN